MREEYDVHGSHGAASGPYVMGVSVPAQHFAHVPFVTS